MVDTPTTTVNTTNTVVNTTNTMVKIGLCRKLSYFNSLVTVFDHGVGNEHHGIEA
jgi:hypothetical protein